MEASIKAGFDGGFIVQLQMPSGYFQYVRPDWESAKELLEMWYAGRIGLNGEISPATPDVIPTTNT